MYVDTVDTNCLQQNIIHCTFNAIYVDPGNISCLQQIIIHSILYMLTLLVQSNYIVDSNTKYSNYMELCLKALNYNKILKQHFELEVLQIK